MAGLAPPRMSGAAPGMGSGLRAGEAGRQKGLLFLVPRPPCLPRLLAVRLLRPGLLLDWRELSPAQ